MQRPRLEISHPDYLLECEEMLERDVSLLVERAEAVGWDRGSIAAAIANLGRAYLLKAEADDATERAIRRSKPQRAAL
ncbi:hypothetical protein DYH55_19315 [Methylovirgula sp. 4M-Z18]|nr:hypothetical protein DYH55_19315 [Methylovirgula sp. 4M-Z18]